MYDSLRRKDSKKLSSHFRKEQKNDEAQPCDMTMETPSSPCRPFIMGLKCSGVSLSSEGMDDICAQAQLGNANRSHSK